MARRDSLIGKPQRGRPNRAERPDVQCKYKHRRAKQTNKQTNKYFQS